MKKEKVEILLATLGGAGRLLVVLGDPVLVQLIHLLQSSLALLGSHGGGLLLGGLGLGSHGILDEHADGGKDTGNEDVQEDPTDRIRDAKCRK